MASNNFDKYIQDRMKTVVSVKIIFCSRIKKIREQENKKNG
jgi:hypothetical protein